MLAECLWVTMSGKLWWSKKVGQSKCNYAVTIVGMYIRDPMGMYGINDRCPLHFLNVILNIAFIADSTKILIR